MDWVGIGDCASHLVLAAYPTRGPTPDVHQLAATFEQLPAGVALRRLLADAGYDSEANHQLLRDEHGIISLIPPEAGRPTSKPAKGRHSASRQMVLCFMLWYANGRPIQHADSLVVGT